MKIKLNNSKYDFDSILKPILLLLLGIIIFINPKGIITISLYAFSLVLFLVGVFKLLLFYKRPIEDKKDILVGIINILIGLVIAIFTYFAFDTVQVIFRFAIACLIIFTVMRIVKAFKQPKNVKTIYLVTSIILLLLAAALMMFDFSITTTGLFISLYSVVEIIGYIINSKYVEENRKIPEANVLSEKEEAKKELEVKE